MKRRSRFNLVVLVAVVLMAVSPFVAAAADHASVTATAMPTCMTPGETKNVSVTVFNDGDTTWSSSDYHVSYHWAGPMNVWDGIRTAITGSVAPAASQTVSAQVKAADTHTAVNLSVGAYTLKWQMIHTGSGWIPVEKAYPVEVKASCGITGLNICKTHPEVCKGRLVKPRFPKKPDPPEWESILDEIKLLHDKYPNASAAERLKMDKRADDLGKKLLNSGFQAR